MTQYKALYTKYRPSKFKEVLGQEHVTDVLQEAIKLGNISHAYLFCGSRGTGKTSVARILAQELGTTADDLYEIDAASNNGVDEIRALNEAVSTMPFSSKFKVYILDEVHMLSKGAFNALLKTLEEPPSHVIFILATTESHKIPDTVVSRCETYTFKKPTQKLLKDFVTKIAKKEEFIVEPAAADLMALLGDGSFRDTHGILQKVISSSKDSKISVEEVEKVTGAPKSDLVNDLIDGILNGDSTKSFEVIRIAVDQNIDMKIYLSLILEKIRVSLLFRFSTKTNFSDSFSAEDLKKIEEWSRSEKLNSKILARFLDAYLTIGNTYLPQIPLELAVFDLTNI